jgi:hypothetical protein
MLQLLHSRVVRRFVPLASLLALTLGCGETKEEPLRCEGAPASAIGEWKHLPIPPPLIYSDPVATDGQQLLIVDGSCYYCNFASLEPSQDQWVVDEYRVSFEKTYSDQVANERYVFGGNSLFDRETKLLLEVERPEAIRSGEWLFSTGREFLLWGGSYPEDEKPGVESGDPMISYFDGAAFDPIAGTWRSIPSAHDEVSWVVGGRGPHWAASWTPSGLFVWGTIDHESAWGALLNVDTMTWKDLRTSGADLPPLRLEARMISVGREAFLYSGREPGHTERSRRMWRYSLSQDQWTEIVVPEWADTTWGGAVVQGKIAFLGQCTGGALFDPKTDTWEALTVQGGPPSNGSLWGVGDFLAVTDTYFGETETNEVWLLDLRK